MPCLVCRCGAQFPVSDLAEEMRAVLSHRDSPLLHSAGCSASEDKMAPEYCTQFFSQYKDVLCSHQKIPLFSYIQLNEAGNASCASASCLVNTVKAYGVQFGVQFYCVAGCCLALRVQQFSAANVKSVF